MKPTYFTMVVIGTILVSIIYTIPFVWAQSNNTNLTNMSDHVVTYLQQARRLLNQTKIEYERGNTTGAEELAIRAYLDNFEYVEVHLEQKGQHQLKEMIESMMRNDLRALIKERAPFQQLNEHINITDDKLIEAINVLSNGN